MFTRALAQAAEMNCAVVLVSLFALGTEVGETVWVWNTKPAEQQSLPPTVGESLSPEQLREIEGGTPITPFAGLTCGVRTPLGALWVGSQHGLMYLAPESPRWRLFHSRRWLPDDRVIGIAVTDDTAHAHCRVVIDTPAGVTTLQTGPTTLESKIDEVQMNLRRYHVRHGLVGEIHLTEPGTIESGRVQHTNDNDGLWTSMYVGAEAFCYGATGRQESKRHARESLEALMFLERITGISGFVARSIVPIEDDPKRYGGEWHRSTDGRWWWKGDTSSDELDGHYFAYAVYYDLCANEAEKKELRGYIARITDHILDHGFYYVGPSGKPTTWGVWAPEKLNHDLEWIDDRGLNSLEILSHLKVAEHMTGDPKYAQVARELIERHSYEMNTVEQKKVWPPGAVNHSDDELAFLAYYPLLMYESDPALRKVYLASLERSWRIERPERSPFFNLIFAACEQASQLPRPHERPPRAFLPPEAYDQSDCLAWFRDVPVDTISWRVQNSHRRDLARETHENRATRPIAHEVLPVSERRVMKWNGDPHELDGGDDGITRDDGAFILLPYWLGRYHRFLD